MPNSERLVVVTGATGRQGGAVARHLVAGGWEVRGLTRDATSDRARALAAGGIVDVVQADLSDVAQVSDALQGAYGVFSVQNPMISGTDAEVAQGTNVADAAKRIGVSHLVYASAGTGERGTGIPSWESKLVVQDHMTKLGLPVTILRPMAFMELMTDKGYYPPVSMWHLMPKLMGDQRPVPWISTNDVGAVAALAFADPDRFIGSDLRLAAEVRTIAECREDWREVMGRPPRRFPMPVWLFERFVGPDLLIMWRWLRTGDVDLSTDATRALLPSAQPVREWLMSQKAARQSA